MPQGRSPIIAIYTTHHSIHHYLLVTVSCVFTEQDEKREVLDGMFQIGKKQFSANSASFFLLSASHLYYMGGHTHTMRYLLPRISPLALGLDPVKPPIESNRS